MKSTIVFSILAGFLGGILSGQILPVFAEKDPTAPTVITAQSFHLVDPEGNLRGKWTSKKGSTLYFLNEKGSPKMILGLSRDGSTIDLDSPDGKKQVSIRSRDQHPLIQLNQNGGESLEISIGDKGAQLNLFNKEGTSRRVFD